jgi:hypothetical protein
VKDERAYPLDAIKAIDGIDAILSYTVDRPSSS